MTPRGAIVAVVALLLTACPAPEPLPCGLTPIYETNTGAVLSMDRCVGKLALGTADDLEAHLSASAAGHPGLAWARDDLETRMVQGRFVFEGTFGDWNRFAGEGDFTGIGGWEGGDEEVSATLQILPGERDSIWLHLRATGGVDRLSFAFGCRDDERWYGTGARPQGTDHTGTTQVLYMAEQGIGQRDYPLDELDLLNGRTGDTYFPVPWTLNDRGVGIGYGGTPIGRMHLCDPFAERDTLRVDVWSDEAFLGLFPSGSPRQAVADWTLETGPPADAPDWAYGPWIAEQRGTDEVLATAAELRAEGIPASAIWAQDWIGGRGDALGGYDLHYHWEWDEEQYPDLPAAIETLHDDGFAFLGYFNPFVTDEFVEWEEAQANGYLPRTPDGEDYEFSIVDRYGSQVDLHDDEAWAWAKGYLEGATAMDQDGWMCDFAEWLPLDATVGDGLSGMDVHNQYPLFWQLLNMEVLDERWGEGNALCFNRSGWSSTHAIAPVTWGGDQETSFGRDDGMPTAREIGVGLGLSGVGRYGSDIAGFSSVFGGPSTKEVYMRWTSMGAFEPVMRTHDGLSEEDNWHWRSDTETTDHFRRYARVHMRLLPYLRMLDEQYVGGGLPFMRHNLLVEPSIADAPDQHFLGDDLLVAPVLEEFAVSRDVVLPEGRWYPFLDEDAAPLDGGQTVTVDAPLTEIPVFAREGAIVPLASEDLVTTYPTRPDDGRLDLVLYAGDGGTLQLDGRSWVFTSTASASLESVALDGAPLADCSEDDATNCRDGDALRITWPNGESTLSGEDWALTVDDAGGLTSTVTFRL